MAPGDIVRFSMCAGYSAASWSRGRHSVYAVELDRAVWKNRAFRDRNPGGAAADASTGIRRVAELIRYYAGGRHQRTRRKGQACRSPQGTHNP
jgi:hypothetical protein